MSCWRNLDPTRYGPPLRSHTEHRPDMLTIDYVEAYKDNYIWLIHSPTDATRIIAVDPGDASPVEDWLERNCCTLAAILVTHRHWDHVNGIEPLVEHWGCPVWGPANERVPCVTTTLREGDTVEVEGLCFTVLDIPGHTAGHIAYHGHGIALVGDTLFVAGCGRLFEGTPAQMVDSLSKLRALPGATKVYCAHEYTEANLRFAAAVDPGNPLLLQRAAAARSLRVLNKPTIPSTISEEIVTNPFLRWDAPAIQVAAAKQAGNTPRNAVEVFATVRLWKDNFT
ncbi:MAG: hydroxyacylglutathione hydrolase [Xanthomonadaceae bacterium]|nr:hydroxyacylglutathione hydrolase [Xanthomonadaceae bacterium]